MRALSLQGDHTPKKKNNNKKTDVRDKVFVRSFVFYDVVVVVVVISYARLKVEPIGRKKEKPNERTNERQLHARRLYLIDSMGVGESRHYHEIVADKEEMERCCTADSIGANKGAAALEAILLSLSFVPFLFCCP